jgi:hypothetical protein
VRAALALIAEDEARHAELGWRILRWAIEAGGAPVRRAVAHAFEALFESDVIEPVPSAMPASLANWRSHGRLTDSELARVRSRGLSQVVEPCARALLTRAWTTAA